VSRVPDAAIVCERLGKRYRIGAHPHHRHIRDALAGAIAAPVRRLGALFGRDGADPRPATSIWAIRDVSFEVEHNGAGKSTLLKVLTRVTEPTEGRARLHGRVGSLLEVGTGFHPELTGRENTFLNGAILGMRRTEVARRFDEIVAFAQVERFIDTPVKHYSSGMFLRLAFSVAAHLESDILLVDEVLAVGDVAFQKKCLGKMREAAGAGRTVLFVSHNMGAVASLCRHAIHLDRGRVKAIGPAEPVVRDYLSELVEADDRGLEQFRLGGYGGEVRFSEIALIAADGGTVGFGDPIACTLVVESSIDTDELSVGSSIFNFQGVCVGTLFTKERFAIAADQRLELRLTIHRPNLAPGFYYAGFSVGRGGIDSGRQDLDIVIGRPSFQVIPVSDSAGPIANWSTSWGNIVFGETELVVEAADRAT
jgi:lipopolysaccharide transport system ATP-binding protein